MTNTVCYPDGIRSFPKSSGWHNVFWTLSYPDELAIGSISSGWLMDAAVCHPDDLIIGGFSSGWLNCWQFLIRWLNYWQYLIRMTWGYCRMSSGWLSILTYLIRMTQRHLNPKSSGWVSSWQYLIRMTFGHCSMSSEWHIIQYIPRNMHTVFALLCFVVVIHWLIFPYPSGLLHWHCGNLTIVPVPAKQTWWIWINTSCEFIMNDCITTTKQKHNKTVCIFLGIYCTTICHQDELRQCYYVIRVTYASTL